METEFDRERIRKWLDDIASTQDEEVDCDALAGMLETVVAVGASGQDISSVLPDVALHIRHCPGCGEWYQTLVDLARQQQQP
jgi:hypothetical protein